MHKPYISHRFIQQSVSYWFWRLIVICRVITNTWFIFNDLRADSTRKSLKINHVFVITLQIVDELFRHRSLKTDKPLRTWDAKVGSGQVARQVVETRARLIHLCVRDAEPALTASGALPIQYLDDVSRAADEAEVNAHASAQPHPTVPCWRHQDDGTRGTMRVEAFRWTVICIIHTYQQPQDSNTARILGTGASATSNY